MFFGVIEPDRVAAIMRSARRVQSPLGLHHSPACHPNYGLNVETVQSKRTAPYEPALLLNIAKTLWIGVGELFGHAKPCFDGDGRLFGAKNTGARVSNAQARK
jgi:hypothetical protein